MKHIDPIIIELNKWWRASKIANLYESSLPFATITLDAESMTEILNIHMKNFKQEVLDEYWNHRIKLCGFLFEKINHILERHDINVVIICFDNEAYEYQYNFQQRQYKFFDKQYI